MTKLVEHKVFLVGLPTLDWHELERYFDEMGYSHDWFDRVNPMEDGFGQSEAGTDAEMLLEFAGRRCYKSFGLGDNPNVTRVRGDSESWFDNLLEVRHGSVLEHGMFTFAIENVSRVETHEHVRHRVGIAISQESMRFVRLDDIPFWMPPWVIPQYEEDSQMPTGFRLVSGDPILLERCLGVLEVLENHQRWMAQYFGIEPDEDGIVEVGEQYRSDLPMAFSKKKELTSFMRRFAPEGVATGMVWSANIRTLRFVLHLRTDDGAEEEIVDVFQKVGDIIVPKFPLAFGDFEKVGGHWQSTNWKV